MDGPGYAFLVEALGEAPAQALGAALDQEPQLGPALLPRAILAWVEAAATQGWTGDLPGLPGSFVRLAKTEAGIGGQADVGGQGLDFDGADAVHVAAALVVLMGLDGGPAPAETPGPALERLGKALDSMAALGVAKRQLDPSRGYRISHDAQESQDLGVVSLKAHDAQGNLVGGVHFLDTPEGLQPDLVHISPEHRRQGLASALYRHAEAITGKKVIPGREQSEAARGLWAQRDRPFGTLAAAEPPGPAAAPREASVEAPVPPRATQPRIKPQLPSLRISKAQASTSCAVCGRPQFEAQAFVGCLCFGALAKGVHATPFKDGYALSFDPGTWDRDAILGLQSALGGR